MKRVVLMMLLVLAAKAMALDDRPKMIRVMVQVVEVPHAMLTKWTGAEKLKGSELHGRAMKLVPTREAEILETIVVICRSGEKALIESFGEWIYPTEYNPPGSLGPLPEPLDGKTAFSRPLRPLDFISFETRNAGTEVEIEPTLDRNGKLVDLRFSVEVVKRASLETWIEFRDQWGDSSVRRPVFDSWQSSTAVTLGVGAFELVSIHSPKPVAVPAMATRQLVFVRAEVLTVGL